MRLPGRPAQGRGVSDRHRHTSANGGGVGRLLTAEELAERWQVAPAQVYRLTRAGKLPVVELGRYYRYRLDAVETFERSGGASANE